MKIKLTLHTILLCLLIIILPLHAQNPTYEARLMNGELISDNQFEFDIFVKRTGTTQFEVYGLQHCLLFDNAILFGGTPSLIYIPGTSQMNAAQIPIDTFNLSTIVNGKRVIKMPARIASVPSNGTIISDTGNGTKFGRFRLRNSFPALNNPFSNLDWNFNQTLYEYTTKYQAYVNGLPVDVTVQANHLNLLWNLPSYQAVLMNGVQTATNQLEFDIYLKRKSEIIFEVYGLSHCLIFNNSILNGGTPSLSYIPGTSEMNSVQIPSSNFNVLSVVGSKRVAKMAAKIPAGPFIGTMISNEGNGTRFGRFRLSTDAASFGSGLAELDWNFNQAAYGYKTQYIAWGNGRFPVDITDPEFHYNNLSDPIVPVVLLIFNANLLNNKQTVLSWSTATETNNYGFQVERKCLTQSASDGLSEGEGINDWMKIGFVEGIGNSTSPKSYSYIDNTLTGGSKFAYRLKQIDHDGTFSLSSIQTIELELKDYVLSQNYPNPFNPSTTIEYIIPEAGQVTLSVYNLLGEKVDDILNEYREAGIFKTEYSSTNLSSGIYIYVLRSNGNAFAKKLLVQK